MQEISINKNDVLEQMYFVLSLVQNSNGPIHSRIGGKSDYMGGIIDRYVNTIVESLVFTKILFPKLKTNKKVELIRDFYSYDPTIATIAPDLFGILIDEKVIPFVVYDNGWKAVKNCPQVEIKTIKKNQRMLSLVNQHYDEGDKYLIFIESDYNTDYLMPFINSDLFNDQLYDSMVEKTCLYSEKIIIADPNGYIKPINKVNFNNDTLGKLKLFIVTKTKNYMNACNIVRKGITPECIEKKELVKMQKSEPISMLNYCNELEKNYFRFNDTWYSLVDRNGRLYRAKESVITLDFYCSNINSIKFLKMNKDNFYIRVNEKVVLNNEELEQGDYKIKLFSGFDRASSANEEYFIDKTIYQRIVNCEAQLINDLQTIIDKN